MRDLSCNFEIVFKESGPDRLVLRDLGPWDKYRTVTNGIELVLQELKFAAVLPPGRRLFYYDSDGDFTEVLLDEDGKFREFKVF